jgi:S-(hydroxymethyl)glutathione dehydrogenase/alcohol dehydrogenase
MPAVLGHESAGIVEQVGSEVRTVKAGRPRDHLPVGLLRPLRALPHRPHVALPSPEVRREQGDEPRITQDGRRCNSS